MTVWFAGIGSRETPTDRLEWLRQVTAMLCRSGLGLRSGAADGADQACEEGCDMVAGKKQIFLPWFNFNKHNSRLCEPSLDAMMMAAAHHPNWDRLTPGVRKLHARNAHQVLGPQLDEPVRFVLCWTPKGSGSGGTGQAIRIARAHEIPVYDCGHVAFDPDVLLQYMRGTR